MRGPPVIACMIAAAFNTAAAEEKRTTAPVLPGPVSVNVSYALNIPVENIAADGDEALERGYRKAMYTKAARECEDLLATISKTCQITNITVSTQFSRYPGQPPAIYVNGSVTMQVDLKN